MSGGGEEEGAEVVVEEGVGVVAVRAARHTWTVPSWASNFARESFRTVTSPIAFTVVIWVGAVPSAVLSIAVSPKNSPDVRGCGGG